MLDLKMIQNPLEGTLALLRHVFEVPQPFSYRPPEATSRLGFSRYGLKMGRIFPTPPKIPPFSLDI